MLVKKVTWYLFLTSLIIPEVIVNILVSSFPISHHPLIERCRLKRRRDESSSFCKHNQLQKQLQHRLASTSKESITDHTTTRKSFLMHTFSVVSTSLLFTSSPAFSDTIDHTNEKIDSKKNNITNKPYAPKEALLPAIRVKTTIDRAIQITNKMILIDGSNASDNNKEELVISIRELEGLILKPQNYVRNLQLQGVPSQPADLYLSSYQPMKGDLPFQLYLSKSGDVSAWKDLKRKEKEEERNSEIRAALNAYTDVLSFSSKSYLLNNVDKATKSQMVREDKLPDIKQVITSDMGMRYLYRNQVLTAMDDVKAELEYQLSVFDKNSKNDEKKVIVAKSSTSSSFDGQELLNLLQIAQRALDRWFSFIDPEDIRQALVTVEMEEKEVKA